MTGSDVDFDVADQAGVLASVAAFARHDVSAHSVRQQGHSTKTLPPTCGSSPTRPRVVP